MPFSEPTTFLLNTLLAALVMQQSGEPHTRSFAFVPVQPCALCSQYDKMWMLFAELLVSCVQAVWPEALVSWLSTPEALSLQAVLPRSLPHPRCLLPCLL